VVEKDMLPMLLGLFRHEMDYELGMKKFNHLFK